MASYVQGFGPMHEIPQGIFNVRHILRHGISGFTSHPKEGVLCSFIAVSLSRV
jgi:hypothetical protein